MIEYLHADVGGLRERGASKNLTPRLPFQRVLRGSSTYGSGLATHSALPFWLPHPSRLPWSRGDQKRLSP